CQKAGKAQKNISNLTRKRSAGGRKVTPIYIYKVLKQVHPDTGISSKGDEHHEQLRQTIFSNVSLRKLPDWHITTNRKFRQPYDYCYRENWAKHAVSEGTKAVNQVHQFK
ncbi:unnamed protein product, partial [Acanthoscelides obtectus]